MAANSADVVVLGSGMAGLAAATRAAQGGAKVILLEKAPKLGGTVPFMGGFLWAAKDLATFMNRMPKAEPELAKLVVEGFQPAVEWAAGLGVQLTGRNDNFFEWGKGYRMEKGAVDYVDVTTRVLTENGGQIITRAPGRSLQMDGTGRVCGITYQALDRRRIERIACNSVIIATGGFHANTEMTTKYFGRWADRMFQRGIPWSTGDGLEMSFAAGAKPSKGFHAFYGQLMPAPPAVVPPEDFRPVTQYNSIHMIIVNLQGERFVDEGIYDSITCQALCQEEKALGFLITDGQIDDHDRRHPATPTSKLLPTERFKNVVDHNGTIVAAETLEELADKLQELGVYRAGLMVTLDEFNTAARSGTAGHLRVAKPRHANAIEKAPFYAIPVVPGISFTHGGITINPRTQALDWQNEPVPGLFAAGADAGGVFYEQYLGGAASALVMGRTAGTAALEA